MARLRYYGSLMAMIALIAGPQFVQSLDMEYCATINTASTPRNSSTWQSNGLCYNFCNEKNFAFAIVQEKGCWCSDYIPYKSAQTDTSQCSDPCPGWKYETCGADGLFGYIELDAEPSGTASAETTSTPESTTTTTTTTKTSSPSTTAEAESTTSEPPTTSIKTVTADGKVSLITVTPTSVVSSDKKPSNSRLNAGATAGIVIGVIALVAIVGGIGAFLYIQRKRRQREEEITSRSDSRFSGSAGIMGTPTTAMASIWDGENTSTGRRSSRMMPHDPRMDPFATNIYSRFDNKSRESINTLQDNQDYSRKVLRTTNPDPPEE